MHTDDDATPAARSEAVADENDPHLWQGQIVVGYDGSPHSQQALSWAAHVAAAGNHPLTLVTSARPLVSTLDGGSLFDPEVIHAEAGHLKADLTTQVEALRQDYPSLDITGRFLIANPALTLIKASEHAELVVLGTPRLSGVAASILGGVGDAVVTHARGPVAVVPQVWQPRPDGPVVAGLESRATSRRMLQYAATRAQERDCELLLLHAWDVRVPWRPELLSNPERTRKINEAWQAEMQDVVAELRQQFPSVAVSTQIVASSAIDALVEQSAHACLVVVGSRGLGGFAGLLVGSTSRRLLQSTLCPTIMVPNATT